MGTIPANIQRLLDRHRGAEEQDRWKRMHLREALADMNAYASAQREHVLAPLGQLIESGAEPESPEVQRLVDRNNELMTRYAVRARNVSSAIRSCMRNGRRYKLPD